MTAKRLVNHNGRTTEAVEDTIEAIRASDLLKLMDVVKEATGLFNAIERGHELDVHAEWEKLGDALRTLGLMEVTSDDSG